MADENGALPQEGADRPDFLASNFDSIEAQARAYNEARTEMGRAHAERDQYRQYAAELEQRAAELEELAAQAQQPAEPELPFNPLAMQLQQAREMGDVNTEMALTAYMASQIADQKTAALRQELETARSQQGPNPVESEQYALWADYTAREKFDAKYGRGAWDDTKVDAAHLLAANPDLIPETLSPTQAADRLVFAAEYVQGQKLLAAPEQERNQILAQRQRRMLATSLTGSGTPPPTQETAEEAWSRIQNAPAGSYSELRNS